MKNSEILIYWVFAALASLTMVMGKLGMALFGLSASPPDDAIAATHWRRKRRWLAISELSAVPAFATFAVAITDFLHLSVAQCVLLSMGLGGLGLGFALHALEILTKRKFNLEADQ